MKIDRLETHDRLLHFKKDQNDIIQQGADDCLFRNSLSLILQERSSYIYLFAHPRTDDDGVTKRLFWQPRLGKPEAQTNSYLFRAISKTDLLEPCWLLPPQETWSQFEKGKVTENEFVMWSIHEFLNNKRKLESPFSDDLSEEKIRSIYRDIEMQRKAKKSGLIL